MSDVEREIMRLAAEAAVSGKLVALKINGETVAIIDAAGLWPRGAQFCTLGPIRVESVS